MKPPRWVQQHATTWAHHGMITFIPCSLDPLSHRVALWGGLAVAFFYLFREIADVVKERREPFKAPAPWWDHVMDAFAPWYVVLMTVVF